MKYIDPTNLLENPVTTKEVAQWIVEFKKQNFKQPAREAVENSSDYEERVEAADNMASAQIAMQMSEEAQILFSQILVQLFEAGHHLFVKDVADMDDQKAMFEAMLDCLVPEQCGKHLRSKLRLIITDLVPRMASHGIDIRTDVIEQIASNNTDGLAAPHAVYAAGVGFKRADDMGLTTPDLVKQVAQAINAKQGEGQVVKIFKEHGVEFNVKREIIWTEAKFANVADELVLAIQKPNGVSLEQLREALDKAFETFSVNVKAARTNDEGDVQMKAAKVQFRISFL